MLGLDSPKCPVKDNVDAEKIGGLSQSYACAWGLEVNLCRASGTLPCTRFSHLQPSRFVGARQEVGTSKRRRCHPKRTSLALFSKTPSVSQVIPCHFPSAYSSQDVVLRLPDHRFLSFGRSQSEHSFPQTINRKDCVPVSLHSFKKQSRSLFETPSAGCIIFCKTETYQDILDHTLDSTPSSQQILVIISVTRVRPATK